MKGCQHGIKHVSIHIGPDKPDIKADKVNTELFVKQKAVLDLTLKKTKTSVWTAGTANTVLDLTLKKIRRHQYGLYLFLRRPRPSGSRSGRGVGVPQRVLVLNAFKWWGSVHGGGEASISKSKSKRAEGA